MRAVRLWERLTGLSLKDVAGRRWDGRRREAVGGLILLLRASGWSYRRIGGLLDKDPAGLCKLARSASPAARALAQELSLALKAEDALGQALARLLWQNLDRALAFAGEEVPLGEARVGERTFAVFLRLEVKDVC